MDSKTKKVLLISSIIVAITLTVFTTCVIYMASTVDNSEDIDFSSGKYHCKINILNEGNAKVFKWDVGISKNKIKNSVTENKINTETLENFRETISEISKEKISLFFLILYLVYISIVFISVQKDTQIYKSENHKKTFQVLFTLLIIFLIYKIITSSIELNELYKDANYYFNLIS